MLFGDLWHAEHSTVREHKLRQHRCCIAFRNLTVKRPGSQEDAKTNKDLEAFQPRMRRNYQRHFFFQPPSSRRSCDTRQACKGNKPMTSICKSIPAHCRYALWQNFGLPLSVLFAPAVIFAPAVTVLRILPTEVPEFTDNSERPMSYFEVSKSYTM